MYSSIYLPVDNSRHSNRAIDTAVALGRQFESKVIGCHVYAAKMHDYRFKQMEYTLPEEYLVEQELSRQRKIHDSLITMGLELVSDCYLEPVEAQCREAGLELERRMMDGKHSTELLKDLEETGCELVVMGIVGVGRTRDSQIGSVCARVTAASRQDVWVVKHVPKAGEDERDTILVGIDGSPRSFGALMTGIELAKRFDKRLEVIGVYDPYLHYAVFKGIVDVLTEKAAKVFRFEEQNQLHEEIIDTGLAQIYQSHLNVAETMAREAGVEVTKTLLDGKAFQKVLDHARKTEPWVLIVGRSGIHSAEDEAGLGSNSENLLRLAPCDVLLTTTSVVPALDLKAEESIHWTSEALERMQRVPAQVQGIARTAILRLAIEQGHSVVSSDLITDAMERFMPKRTAEANVRLAEALVIDRAERAPVAICRGCGVAARTARPVLCTVCGGKEFESVSQEVIARIIAAEGGVEEETTYDGRKIRWTQESREALKVLEDRYQRRRAKARIEKAARLHKLDPITVEFAERFIAEEAGVLYRTTADYDARRAAGASGDQSAVAVATPVTAAEADAEEAAAEAAERRLLARDGANVPFLSARDWDEEALERILRVPAGFMRDRTQQRVEELAAGRNVASIDLALVEAGIQLGVAQMEEMLAEQAAVAAAATAPSLENAADGNGHSPTANGGHGEQEAAVARCPMHRALEQGDVEVVRDVLRSHPLTEVSVMSEMERRRRALGRSDH